MGNKLNAIILAGTSTKKSKLIYEHYLFPYYGLKPENKGLVKINNKPVILNVLNALYNSKYVNQDKIAIIGPKQKLEKIIDNQKILFLQEEKTLIENAKKSYDNLSINKEPTFFITCDLPFINTKAIDDFISQCNKYKADFYFPLINVKNIPEKIEELKKSMKFHLKGKGNYRTANMSLFDGKKIKDRTLLEDQINRVFENRRTTSCYERLKLYASILKPYWWEIIKHSGLRCLTKENVSSAIKRELGINLQLIETQYPETAVDIDYQKDYEIIKEYYEQIKEDIEKYHLQKNI